MSDPAQKHPVPAGYRAIADAAGDDAACKLCLELGGTWIDIPQKSEGTKLERIVGADAAALIVERIGPGRLELPLANKTLACALNEQGMEVMNIAKRLRTQRRTVQRWLQPRDDPRQQTIFDIIRIEREKGH